MNQSGFTCFERNRGPIMLQAGFFLDRAVLAPFPLSKLCSEWLFHCEQKV